MAQARVHLLGMPGSPSGGSVQRQNLGISDSRGVWAMKSFFLHDGTSSSGSVSVMAARIPGELMTGGEQGHRARPGLGDKHKAGRLGRPPENEAEAQP